MVSPQGTPETCADDEQRASGLDLDGDDRMDRLVLHYVAEAGTPCYAPQWIRFELASGTAVDHETPLGGAIGPIGTTDLNQDGHPETWLEYGGASAFAVGLVGLDAEGRFVDFGTWKYFGKYYGQSGVECVDIDGDGRREVIETYLGAPDLRSQGNYAPPLDGSWSYSAFRIDRSGAKLVRKDSGKDSSSRPLTIQWSDGFRCPMASKAVGIDEAA